MKKAILLTLLIPFLALQVALAQSSRNIPAAVTNAFNAKYPNMKVTDWDWEEDKNAYEAEFKMNGKEMEAWFSPDGTWLKTKTEIKKDALPAAVTRAMTTGEYSTWKMDDYAEMDMPEGKRYKVKAKKGGEVHYLKFDASGQLVEKKDKKEKETKMKIKN